MDSKRFYKLLRDLHLYVGLVLSPVILLFAVSAGALAIEGLAANETPVQSGSGVLTLSATGDSVALAKRVRQDLRLPGEIGFVRNDLKAQRIEFPLQRPGDTTKVAVDLRSGAYQWTRTETGLIDALVYLHKKPGPHNVALRGNWWPMAWWAWLADGTVYLLLLISVTGVYLWAVIRRERKLGLILLGAGAVTFAASVIGVAG